MNKTEKKLKIKLPPGPCVHCGKRIRIQKFWCNILCQSYWEERQKLRRIR